MPSYLEKLTKVKVLLGFNPFKTELSTVSQHTQNSVKHAKHIRQYILFSKNVLVFNLSLY